jgi:hypothetical protein
MTKRKLGAGDSWLAPAARIAGICEKRRCSKTERLAMNEVVITLICHSSGLFSVGKNLGGLNESFVFKTRKEADAKAEQLKKADGPIVKVRIVIIDFTIEEPLVAAE